MCPEARGERPFDEVARGLGSGGMSRREALKWMDGSRPPRGRAGLHTEGSRDGRASCLVLSDNRRGYLFRQA
jgi:hypothetical protein